MISSLSRAIVAFRMDPPHHPMAGEPYYRQHAPGCTAQTGGVPWLPPQAQAPQAGGEGPAGDHLQHAADPPAPQQQTRLPAHRGQDGLRHRQRLEGTGVRREGIWGMAPLWDAKVCAEKMHCFNMFVTLASLEERLFLCEIHP